MTSTNRFSVSIASNIPTDEREALVLSLRSYAHVQEMESRDVGMIWITFVAVIKDLGSIVETVSSAALLAEKIIAWRRTARQQHVAPQVHLQKSNQLKLDLEIATDEEVLAWFLGELPKD